MTNSRRDQNYVTSLLAASNADGITPVVLWADPVTHRLLVQSSGGGSSTFVNNEIVSGSGTSWTLAQTPLAGAQNIYAQGIRLYPGSDPNFGYSITGSAITTQQSYTTGDLIADYQTS